MMTITVETKISALFEIPELQPYSRYLIYGPNDDPANSWYGDYCIRDLAKIGWSAEGIVSGLNTILRAAAEQRVAQHFVYSDAECSDDPGKKAVNLIQISPEKPNDGKPFIILCAGGGYTCVCTMVEALPTAKHFVDAGYTVFLMTYRVAVSKAAIKALDDLAAAVNWLGYNADRLGIDHTRYAVGGYSAGANLISNWGCAHIGWKHYGAPKPICMFPIYTLIDLETESHRDEHGGLLPQMLGDEWPGLLSRYNVGDHIDADYPPCYIVCGKDDVTVPCSNSELMKQRLDAAGVPSILEEGNHAAHGFGDGLGTDVEGWPERAIRFVESL